MRMSSGALVRSGVRGAGSVKAPNAREGRASATAPPANATSRRNVRRLLIVGCSLEFGIDDFALATLDGPAVVRDAYKRFAEQVIGRVRANVGHPSGGGSRSRRFAQFAYTGP